MFNGRISTLDAEDSVVEAIAIKDGTIVGTGTNGFVSRMGGRDTKRINLGGSRVIPGLLDGHLHGLRNGYHCFNQAVRLDLVTSRDAALALYAERAASLADDRWVWTTFGGWHIDQLDTPGMFTIDELDAASPDNPVWVTGLGFSGQQVNTRALDVLGLGAGDDGVELDADGAPTGRLVAPATAVANAAILAQVDAASIDEQVDCLVAFIADANRLGLTGWQDPEGNQLPWGSGGQEFSQGLHGHQAVVELHRNGGLNARVGFRQMNNFLGFPQVLSDTRNTSAFLGDDMLRLLGIGEEFYTADNDFEDYDLLTSYAAQNRMSLEHHGSAEHEIDMNLEGYEIANQVYPIEELIWTIAHPGDGLPTDEQLDRANALGVGWTLTIGSTRSGGPGPRYRDVLENSAHMCLATDAMNVAPYPPFQKLWYVVTGQTLLPGVEGVPADQRLTRDEALRHSTVECAWNIGQDGKLGTLEVGKHADLIVLSADYFAVDESEIKDIYSLLTVVDGRIVHAEGKFARHLR